MRKENVSEDGEPWEFENAIAQKGNEIHEFMARKNGFQDEKLVWEMWFWRDGEEAEVENLLN